LGKRNVLVQELPAIEGLARVDTVCFDKTGTLTEGRLTVEQLVLFTDRDPAPALAALAAAETDPNVTLAAIGASYPDDPGWGVQRVVPFSSARKWSAVSFYGGETWVLGAPEVVAPVDEHVREIVAEYAA